MTLSKERFKLTSLIGHLLGYSFSVLHEKKKYQNAS